MIIDFHIILIVLIFILLDIISGVSQAVKNHTLSSTVMRDGIYHKLGYILILTLAATCEFATSHIDLGFDAPIILPCAIMISTTEILSIIENIERLNPELANTGIFQLLSQNKMRRKDDIDDE